MVEEITATEVKERLAMGLSPASILYHVALLCAQPGQTPESVAEALGVKTHWVTTKLRRTEELGGLCGLKKIIGSLFDKESEFGALAKLRCMYPEKEFLSVEWWQQLPDEIIRSKPSAKMVLRAVGNSVLTRARLAARKSPEGKLQELKGDAVRVTEQLVKLRSKMDYLLPEERAGPAMKNVNKACEALELVVERLKQLCGQGHRFDNGIWEFRAARAAID